MKRFFCLLGVLFFFCSAESENALSIIENNKTTVQGQDLFEKPKPGTKRWHRSQRHLRNTRRKKYPRMSRGGKQQADWTVDQSGRNLSL